MGLGLPGGGGGLQGFRDVGLRAFGLRAFDVKDAFLTVPQQAELYVRLDDAVYRVWKCLPGQQLAPAQWYDQLSVDMKQCGLEASVAFPVAYGQKSGESAATVHVDDGLLGGFPEQFDRVVNFLSSRYKLEVSEPLQKVGDRLRFLKRTLEVVPDGLMISIDGRYIDKMVELLGLVKRRVPATHELLTLDESDELPTRQVTMYRAVIGCLLYIAPDRPDCQRAISVLARGMSRPTTKQLQNLKYLVEYVYHTKSYSLVLQWSYPGKSCLDERKIPRLRAQVCGGEQDNEVREKSQPRLLEALSDSDWAGASDRRSMSCGQLFLGGNFVFGFVRRQATIALSSCEAEMISATGVLAEALFLKSVIQTMCNSEVQIKLRCDSSSARSLLTKSGVSRVRHLDTRLLWTQQLTKSGQVQIEPISTALNTSDIGTKPLHGVRIKQLLGRLHFHDENGSLSDQVPQITSSKAKVAKVSTMPCTTSVLRLVLLAAAMALGQSTEVSVGNKDASLFHVQSITGDLFFMGLRFEVTLNATLLGSILLLGVIVLFGLILAMCWLLFRTASAWSST